MSGSSVLLANTYHLLLEPGVVSIMSPPDWAPLQGVLHRGLGRQEDRDVFDAAVLAIDGESVTREMRDSAIEPAILDRTPAGDGLIIQVLGYPGSRI